MIRAIGVLESNSISQGINAVDQMLKSGSVQLLESKPVCPGKYMSIIYGDVGSVESSMAMGKSILSSTFVDAILIPNIHEEVIRAIAGISDPKELKAIGVLEFFSIAGAIYAADTAVKAADVTIVNMRLGIAIGGKSYVTLTGNIGAINSAVEAGKVVGKAHGLLFGFTTIASPHKDLLSKLI